MTQTTPTYAPGTPLWVDLGTSDLEASTRFYGQLFGWDAEDMGEQAGHYTMFRQGGKAVAAVGPIMNPGQPTAWSTYVATDDVDATVRKVTDAGGKVLMGPMQVMEEGKMAVLADPTGAVISVWQPQRMQGAELVNTPVSFSWNELQTRDPEAAKAFYPKVFPWGVKVNETPGAGEYIEWQVNGRSIAGGMGMAPNMPAQVPPHWVVYFTVANTDEIVKRAQEMGAQVMSPPMDIPQGRFAVLTDPQGAVFAVIQNTGS